MTRIAMMMATGLLAGGCIPTAEARPDGAAPPARDFEAPCNAAAAQPLIGRPWNQALNDEAVRLTGAGAVRVIRPGDAITMDYRTDRLNIELDGQSRVTAIHCG